MSFSTSFFCPLFFWVQYHSSIRICFILSLKVSEWLTILVFAGKCLYLSFTLRVYSILTDSYFPSAFWTYYSLVVWSLLLLGTVLRFNCCSFLGYFLIHIAYIKNVFLSCLWDPKVYYVYLDMDLFLYILLKTGVILIPDNLCIIKSLKIL